MGGNRKHGKFVTPKRLPPDRQRDRQTDTQFRPKHIFWHVAFSRYWWNSVRVVSWSLSSAVIATATSPASSDLTGGSLSASTSDAMVGMVTSLSSMDVATVAASSPSSADLPAALLRLASDSGFYPKIWGLYRAQLRVIFGLRSPIFRLNFPPPFSVTRFPI